MNKKPKFSTSQLSPELLARLKAETKTPYKGLRKFFYFAFGASGLIGGVIFVAQLLAGKYTSDLIPNIALQFGVVALMVFLFRLEDKPPAS